MTDISHTTTTDPGSKTVPITDKIKLQVLCCEN